jgi:hypothetical protein
MDWLIPPHQLNAPAALPLICSRQQPLLLQTASTFKLMVPSEICRQPHHNHNTAVTNSDYLPDLAPDEEEPTSRSQQQRHQQQLV